jgi:predicted nucleic acid-binding protein
MKTYFDSGILIGLVLSSHSQNKACSTAFAATNDRMTSGHALAETFSSLTSHYKVPNNVAAELIVDLLQLENFHIEALSMEDYETAITEAKKRGVMGGGIYDSLHATCARRMEAKKIVTLNLGDFLHVAPDMQVTLP